MGASKRKLLIIDDDMFVRQNIVAYLEDSGYDVREAANGPDGLTLFSQFKPEIVLSDLMMPDVSGMRVLEQIHQQSPSTPVIVISGVGVVDDVVEALRLGASDYLVKPIVDMEVLEHAIRKGLERSDLIAENRRYREELEDKNSRLQQNLEIFERDQKAGRQVQQRLLPANPLTRGGYTLSHYMRPSLYLSGDFIDYAYFLNRYFGFYLTDVAGHGASSAFVTIWLKYLVRNLMRDRTVFIDSTEEHVFRQGPNLLLKGINRELMATRLNNHLTSFQGTIDSKTDKMRYAVGGHLPLPILITNDGAQYLVGRGKPLGIFNDAEWEVYEIQLPEKFALVIFSDGILDMLSEDGLVANEALLLDKISNMEGVMTIDAVCECLGIDPSVDTPDDVSVMLVTRGH